MTRNRTRLWLGIGLSVLAPALPAAAQGHGCAPALDRMLAQGGEAGEGGGESGAQASPVPVLDRMAAQLAGAAERRASGDAESAEILVGAATDDGPARLARQGADPGLEAELAPLAAAPADAAAASRALRAIEARLAAHPAPPAERAAALAGLALDAYGDAQDCGQGVDRAAYAEARALVLRAEHLLAGNPAPSAREMAEALHGLETLLPAAAPPSLPPLGQVSALVSRVQLAASDTR